MTIHASVTFEIKIWDEKPYDEFEVSESNPNRFGLPGKEAR